MNKIATIANELLYDSRKWWERVANGMGGQLAYFKKDMMTRRIVITGSIYGDLTIKQEWSDNIPQDSPVTIIRLGEEESFKRRIPIDDKYIDRLKLFIKSYKRIR